MVSVFKASNIIVSVWLVLRCTAGKLALPLPVVNIDAAFSVPPLVFVAAATAPPLVIGARTRNFRIQRAAAYQHDRSPAPSPFIAIKGPLTKQKRVRNLSETWQKQGKKGNLLTLPPSSAIFFVNQRLRNKMAKLRVPFQFLMLSRQTWLWNRRRCSYYC